MAKTPPGKQSRARQTHNSTNTDVLRLKTGFLGMNLLAQIYVNGTKA